MEESIIMASIRDQLVEVIDCLPEEEQSLLLRIALRFLPDDVLTPTERARIDKAAAEMEAGEYVRDSDIDWD